MTSGGMFQSMGTSREKFGREFLGSWAGKTEPSELTELKEKVDKLQKSVDELTQYIKFVIGGHVLVKGKWVPLNEFNGTKVLGSNKRASPRRRVQGGKQC